ncbi:hypothetical protein [Neisseria sp.]|uniref:hypothetical protein n=1 Tax=Neisseria sp. TaxID=192066 RepID=UPI0035A04D19
MGWAKSGAVRPSEKMIAVLYLERVRRICRSDNPTPSEIWLPFCTVTPAGAG